MFSADIRHFDKSSRLDAFLFDVQEHRGPVAGTTVDRVSQGCLFSHFLADISIRGANVFPVLLEQGRDEVDLFIPFLEELEDGNLVRARNQNNRLLHGERAFAGEEVEVHSRVTAFALSSSNRGHDRGLRGGNGRSGDGSGRCGSAFERSSLALRTGAWDRHDVATSGVLKL